MYTIVADDMYIHLHFVHCISLIKFSIDNLEKNLKLFEILHNEALTIQY